MIELIANFTKRRNCMDRAKAPFYSDGRPYYSLNAFVRDQFGKKLYRLALDGGMTCPNRDGTLGTGGCIFCSHGGSGDFAEPRRASVSEQIQAARERVAAKYAGNDFIAYFQSYTNTYAPVSYLETLFEETIRHPDVAVLSVATRPDCLPDETVRLLARLNRQKPVWVELGLQTIHEPTARLIGRGYPLPVFTDAALRLKEAGLPVIVHVILGLPGESRDQMLESVRWLAAFPRRLDGIKLQLLHILRGTRLADLYQAQPFPVLSREEYIRLLIDCIRLLPPDMVIHRLSGDGPRRLLLEPSWTADKHGFLNAFSREVRAAGIRQGDRFSPVPDPALPAYSACGVTLPAPSI